MGILDGLFGGGNSLADLYGDLLTPKQLAALQSEQTGQGLLRMAGAFADAGMPSRMPIPLGSAIGKAAAAFGGGQEEALKGIQTAAQIRELQAKAKIREQMFGPEADARMRALFERLGGVAPTAAPAVPPQGTYVTTPPAAPIGGPPASNAPPPAALPLPGAPSASSPMPPPNVLTPTSTLPSGTVLPSPGPSPGAGLPYLGAPGAEALPDLPTPGRGAGLLGGPPDQVVGQSLPGQGVLAQIAKMQQGGDATGGLPFSLAAFRGGSAAPSSDDEVGSGTSVPPGTRYSMPMLKNLAESVGFKGQDADTMAATWMGESGGNPWAKKVDAREASYGLAQINARAHAGGEQAYGDPDYAAQKSFDLYQADKARGGSGFRDWSIYNSGAYKQFLPGGPDTVIPSGRGLSASMLRNVADTSSVPGMPPVPSVPGVDPKAMNALLLELAQRNAAAEALGMGNPYGSMLSVLQGSPQYKGMIETATRGAGLPFVEPESAAKARGTFPYDMAGKQYQAALDRATQQEKILGEAANDPAEIRVADGKGGFAIVQGTRAQKIRAAEGLPVPALGITGIFAPGSAGVAPAGSLAPTPYIDEIAKAQAGPQASGAEQRKTEAFQVAPGAVADPRMLPPGPGTTQPITLPNGTILPPAKLQPSTSGQSIVQTREEQKIDATQEGEWYKGIGSATFAENRLLAIADALKSFQSGQFQGNLADLRAKLSSVGIHVPDSFAGDPAKAQQILKDNFSASVEMMKSTGLSRWTQQELASAQTAMANPNLEPAANHSIIAQAVGAIRWERGMQDAYAQAKQYGWTKPNAFQLYYAQQNPLGPVVEQTKKELGPFKGMPQPPSPGTTYSPATEPRKLRWNPATGRAE